MYFAIVVCLALSLGSVHSGNVCLKAHNVLRNLHENTGPLQWDAKLAADSKIWAENLVSIGQMKHSYRPNEGENIYYSKSKNEGSCVDAALAWYNEIKDYRYANPGFSGATGHFTQVVWKDSTKVGVGIAHSAPDGAGFITTYIVAKYTPQGNFYQRGKEAEAFRANVASRKSGAKTPTRYEIDPSLCKDNSDAATCGNYKNWGFCQSYRSFIGSYCAKTCLLC